MSNTITLSSTAAATITAAAYALAGKVAAWHLYCDALDAARTITIDGVCTLQAATVAHVDAVAAGITAAINRLSLPTGTIKAARKTAANYSSALRTAAERGVAYRDSKGQPVAYGALIKSNTAADPAEAAAAEAAAAAAKEKEAADEAAAAAAEAAIRESMQAAEAAAAATAAELADLRAAVQRLTAERDAAIAERDAAIAERDALKVTVTAMVPLNNDKARAGKARRALEAAAA